MTQRTKAQLDALFADNTSGLITPIRLRDFVETMKPSHAGMHFADPGTVTTIAASSTFVKAANASTSHSLHRFTMPADNRLQYDGDVDVEATITATLSFTCESNNQVLAFAIAINGSVDVPSIIRTKISTGSDIQAVTIQTHTSLSPGDYVEIWVANDTSAADITIDHGHVHAVAFMS